MAARTFCDRGIALAREGHAEARPRLILAATILASSLDFVDSSVVNVGLPAIGRSLHGQADTLQWAVNGYLLPLSALLLLGGALGDRFGKRRLLVAGIIAAASPCRARAAISQPRLGAAAQSAEPAAKTAMPITSSRRLP